MEEKVKLDQRRSPTKGIPSIQPTMNFGTALGEAVSGRRIRRLDWEDTGIYLTFREDSLMIFLTQDKMLHPLIVRIGDVIGTDWVIVK